MAEGRGRVGTWDVARPRGIAWPSGAQWLGGAREFIARSFATDTAAGRLMPWLPVCFGLGVVFYFTAEHEPAIWAGGTLAVGLAAAVFAARARPLAFPLLLAAAAIAAGVAICTPKTAVIAAPIPQPRPGE